MFCSVGFRGWLASLRRCGRLNKKVISCKHDDTRCMMVIVLFYFFTHNLNRRMVLFYLAQETEHLRVMTKLIYGYIV